MFNSKVKVIFIDGTETSVPGVYGYSYTAVDDVTFSRGNWRHTYLYTKIGSVSNFSTEDDGAPAVVNGFVTGTYRVPDDIMGIPPRTKYEAVILLQLLDADDAVLGQFLTNDIRAWHVTK